MSTASSRPSVESLNLCGGTPGLDLVNSVNPRSGPEKRIDHLGDYEQLVRWAVHASVIPASQQDALLVLAAASPRKARAVWRRVIELREALFRIVRALSRGQGPPPADLAVIDRERHRADRETLLVAGKRRGNASSPAVEVVPAGPPGLEAPLWPLVRSAVELLTDTDPTRLRECPAEAGGCGWIVLDETRNRSRRWCDMRVCGNRVKAARLTERRRKARTGKQGKRDAPEGSR